MSILPETSQTTHTSVASTTVNGRIPSQLDRVEFYVDRLRRYEALADRRSAFSAMVEALADDQWPAPETTVARLRLAVAALRQVEADGR